MIVYGRYKTRYDLIMPADRKDRDGEYYRVRSMPDKQVKLYFKEFRTKEQEYKVISAINGDMPLEREDPTEVVYHNGRFVGYITDYEDAVEEMEVPDESAESPHSGSFSISPSVGLLCSVIIGIVLSVLLYLLVFDRIAMLCSETVAYYNFNGIPMMIGGAALLLFCTYYFRTNPMMAAILSAPAYVVGAAAVFLVIFLLVTLIEFAISMIVPLVFILAIAAAVIGGLKFLLKLIGIRR